MRTLIPFLEKMDADVIQGPIVADAGYGSEPNYEFIEDKFGVLDYLIPYNTMLKEETKCWGSDERKVMNWHYIDEDRKEDPNALTKKGNDRKIYTNPQWEYFKGKVKTNLSNTKKIRSIVEESMRSNLFSVI